MKRADRRPMLIDGAIHVIANEGLDKATTKRIGDFTDTNEVYIYRCFESKEDMLVQTFHFLDDELISTLKSNISVMYVADLDFDLRARLFFDSIWKFLLGNKDKCLAFIRLYYSPYYMNYSYDTHQEKYAPIIEQFKLVFMEESNVTMILNHILTTMLVFAINVFNGAVPDNEDTAEHVFRLIHASVSQYLKRKES